jgi:excisionase family DNA binding protein
MFTLPINKSALTVAEAASVLGISSCKIYQMIKAGILPGQKLGHAWRVPADAIAAYMRQK